MRAMLQGPSYKVLVLALAVPLYPINTKLVVG